MTPGDVEMSSTHTWIAAPLTKAVRATAPRSNWTDNDRSPSPSGKAGPNGFPTHPARPLHPKRVLP
eukprot:10707960-Prorocentrum_lima.AAC.1